MQHNFQVLSIDPTETSHFFDMTDDELAAVNACRRTADRNPGFPCRVSLQDAEVGEEVILFNYLHHDAASPYRATGPVYVRKNARRADLSANQLPGHLSHRLLSLRGYDAGSMLVDARSAKGDGLENELQSLFSNKQVRYVHIHNAAQGCFHCRVERVI